MGCFWWELSARCVRRIGEIANLINNLAAIYGGVSWGRKVSSGESYIDQLGRGIRKLRKQKKWTQGELAARSGVDRATISQLENGKGNPSAQLIESLANALETTVPGLFVASRKSFRKRDQDLINYVGAAVSARRLELGLTRKELADRAGFLPQYISTTENCRRLPTVENLYKLAQALEVSILYFWPDVEDIIDFNPIAPCEIGERIKEKRIEQGMSGADLAAVSGVASTYLSSIEQGSITPRLSILRLLVRGLSEPVSKFLEK